MLLALLSLPDNICAGVILFLWRKQQQWARQVEQKLQNWTRWEDGLAAASFLVAPKFTLITRPRFASQDDRVRTNANRETRFVSASLFQQILKTASRRQRSPSGDCSMRQNYGSPRTFHCPAKSLSFNLIEVWAARQRGLRSSLPACWMGATWKEQIVLTIIRRRREIKKGGGEEGKEKVTRLISGRATMSL